MEFLINLPGIIFTMSVISFVLYAYDKHQAYYCKFRVPEFVLMAVTVLGGAIGTIPAMYYFRHKIRKRPFVIVGWLFFILVSIALLWSFYRICSDPYLLQEYFSNLGL